MTIIKLDKNLANQIAAWEVVEKPFSVVKELVENSIDANANNIKVEIVNGWIDEIIITDNWTGIEKSDLEMIAEKYSTSKIKNLEDLYKLLVLGEKQWLLFHQFQKYKLFQKLKILNLDIY